MFVHLLMSGVLTQYTTATICNLLSLAPFSLRSGPDHLVSMPFGCHIVYLYGCVLDGCPLQAVISPMVMFILPRSVLYPLSCVTRVDRQNETLDGTRWLLVLSAYHPLLNYRMYHLESEKEVLTLIA